MLTIIFYSLEAQIGDPLISDLAPEKLISSILRVNGRKPRRNALTAG